MLRAVPAALAGHLIPAPSASAAALRNERATLSATGTMRVNGERVRVK